MFCNKPTVKSSSGSACPVCSAINRAAAAPTSERSQNWARSNRPHSALFPMVRKVKLNTRSLSELEYCRWLQLQAGTVGLTSLIINPVWQAIYCVSFGKLHRKLVDFSFSQHCKAKIRFKFQDIDTSVHSPATASRPRSENCRKPNACLIMPKTGSTVHLRLA